MHLRFQKRIKILPGIRINLSKSGISATLGAGPLHLNLGKRGPMVTASLPGTGLSIRHKVASSPEHGNGPEKRVNPRPSSQPPPLPRESWDHREIKSLQVNELTSSALQEVHAHFRQAAKERSEIRSQIAEAEQNLLNAEEILQQLSENRANEFPEDKTSDEWQNYTQELHKYIASLRQLIQESELTTEIEIQPEILPLFEDFQLCFLAMALETQAWDETALNTVTRSGQKAALKHVSEIHKVECSTGELALVGCQLPVPHLGNANGGDLYFYPGFLVVYYTDEAFALIGFDELETRISKTQSRGCDASAVDRSQSVHSQSATSELIECPCARIEFRTESGLHESYLIENLQAAECLHDSITRMLSTFRQQHEVAPESSEPMIPESAQYECPGRDCLDFPDIHTGEPVAKEELLAMSEVIVKTLSPLGARLTPEQITRGHRFTLYEFSPEPGYPIARLRRFGPELSLATGSDPVRILAPVPGRATVGIEVVNRVMCPVVMSDLLSRDANPSPEMLVPFAIGLDVTGKTYFADLHDMPNLLIAGTTGSGKTFWINSLIASLLFRFRPDELKLSIIDLDGAATSPWGRLPHLFGGLAMDPIHACATLRMIECELNRRIAVLAESGTRNIKEYNKRSLEKLGDQEDMPSWMKESEKVSAPSKLNYIIVIIDGLSCLMKAKRREAEPLLSLVASRGAACGIHLAASVQSVQDSTIPPMMREHFPSRIAFQTTSAAESRSILNLDGAESLSGSGDMLFLERASCAPTRLLAANVSDAEMKAIANICAMQMRTVASALESFQRVDDPTQDSYPEELVQKCIELVRDEGKCSTSLLQRRLRLGYSRAAALVDVLEKRGIVGPGEAGKPRELI